MSNLISVNVPDIGDVSDVDIIELLVAEGDTINKDDPLITLETDKATMEVPSSDTGVVKKIHVAVGDKVSQGDLVVELEASDSAAVVEEVTQEPQPETQVVEAAQSSAVQSSVEAVAEASEAVEKDLIVPDIGDAKDVDVIEVLVAVGDTIEKEQSLIVLETDKATMEVPASDSGELLNLNVKIGDKVSQGDLLGRVKSSGVKSTGVKSASGSPVASSTPAASMSTGTSSTTQANAPAPSQAAKPASVAPQAAPVKSSSNSKLIHASPAVRRFARELGADLAQVKGTGNKGRIQKEDVQNYIKQELAKPKSGGGSGDLNLAMPDIDHSKWGEVEEKALTRIQKVSSANLHRNWVAIPHVTQHEDADITELDAFRKSLKEEAAKDGVRLTPLAFIMKGLVHSLKAFPKFNASLASDGENLVLKHYYHIGVAVETPDGLTVPVIRDVDKKGIYQLATELGEVSAKARDKKLSADDMQGSSFTISSLGGIGGTAFSPIVKWPDVAILGLSRNKMQPVWNGSEFVPRLMLPMSLSYDHRVIDGADAARFVVHLAQTLKDIRRVLLK
jgi:pyruvate dehydrogenase E2 component (dihydrolipoamide acetyltransferase)